MKRARVACSGAIHEATPHAQGVHLADGRVVAEDAVVWLPPFEVGTIIALGLNYADHAKELAFKAHQEEPLVFLKGAGALIGHRGQTRRPADVGFMHYECELAVVIGAPAQARRARRRDAARRRLHGGQRLRDPRLPGKLVPPQPAREEPRRRHACSARGSSTPPTSPRPDGAGRCARWSTARSRSRATRATWCTDIPSLIEYLSGFMTLQAGDVILTGTPEGVVERERRRRSGHRDRRHRSAGQHHRRRRRLRPLDEFEPCASIT